MKVIRSHNIGTENYALLTSSTDPEMLLPVKVKIMDKKVSKSKAVYKVKVLDIYESNFQLLKELLSGYIVSNSPMMGQGSCEVLVKKADLDKMVGLGELLTYLNDKAFYLEDNYITTSKEGLRDLYLRFVKYMINYHYSRLFMLTSRSFLAGTTLFENQKDVFKRRVERLGFGDTFQKNGIKLDI